MTVASEPATGEHEVKQRFLYLIIIFTSFKLNLFFFIAIADVPREERVGYFLCFAIAK